MIYVILTWKVGMCPFLVHQNRRNCIDVEMLFGNLWSGGIEGAVCLVDLCDVIKRVPEETGLRTDVRKEYWMIVLQQVNAVHSGDLLDRWTRHSHYELKEFLLGAVSIEDVLVVALDAIRRKGIE